MPLKPRPVADVASVFEGWSRPVFGIALDGTLYACARVSTEPTRVEQEGFASFPKSKLDAVTTFKIWRSDTNATLEVKEENIVVSYVQPHPKGILLVGARCHWHPTAPEQNALVVDAKGHVVDRFTLGDGINDVRVRENTIWVSYFDEGVFGNYGWNDPGPAPIGSAGLVAFDAAGKRTFAYDSRKAKTDAICDAYAFNLCADGTAWVYFYTEFPIVRIRGGDYTSWFTGIEGAKALAVKGGRVLLAGGYGHSKVARILELGKKAKVAGETEIAMDGFLVGVGERMYVVTDTRVFVIDDW